tara:strand:- start:2695 stop:3801 length:1107 start_codon:yes stop_codon:yes gene_type:complete
MGYMDYKRKIFGSRGVRGFLKAKKVERKIFGPGGFKSRYGIGRGRGGIKLARMGADLEKIKDQLNVEKKSIEVGFDGGIVGVGNFPTNERGGTFSIPSTAELYAGQQVCAANTRGKFEVSQSKITGAGPGDYTTGMSVKDITPVVAKGDSPHERNGKKIKFTGMTMRLHYSLPREYAADAPQGRLPTSALSTYHAGARGKLYIIHTTCDDVTEAMIKNKFLQKNNHTHVVDYGSERNYDNLSDFKVVYQKRFYVKPPSTKGFDFVEEGHNINEAAVGATDGAKGYLWPAEEQILQCKLKLAHHLRWRDIDDATSFNGRFFAVFVLDRGNRGTTNGNAHSVEALRTLNGLLATQGIELEGAAKWWYVDN